MLFIKASFWQVKTLLSADILSYTNEQKIYSPISNEVL